MYTRKNEEYWKRTTTIAPPPSTSKVKYTYYYFSSNHNLRVILDSLIYELQNKTCIRFTESKNKQDSNISIRLGWKGTRPKTSIVQSKKLSKVVEFPLECKDSPGCIYRHFLYMLGIIPTHKRPDRDTYITVNKANVDKKNCFFENYTEIKNSSGNTMSFGDYDFGSLAHTKQYRCHKNFQPPISAKIKAYNDMMGHDSDLSFNDQKLINLALSLCNPQKCSVNLTQECQNYGYQNPNNCNKCICPTGFEGQFCEKMISSDNECNGTSNISVTEEASEIKLNGRMNCYYNITTSKNHRIEFNIKHVKTGDQLICYSGVGFELKHRKDVGATGLCLCKEKKNITVRTDMNYAYLIYNGFQSDFLVDLSFKR
uniref:Astacin domain-containing protein n=1 Tax=Parastrongyloides trichosuri TaxID=131310 RepID=A0A0N4Z1K2_PARTI